MKIDPFKCKRKNAIRYIFDVSTSYYTHKQRQTRENQQQQPTKTDAELGFKLILLPFYRILNFDFSRSLFSFLIPAFCFQMRLPLNRVCCFRECIFYPFLPKNF